ncbi:hypothetical protein [Pontibacillus salipaludis]|uniref:hypothetical protein n=1 Tax=Pontibacillus salipaludis TaxID=1697394 RepID=UPI0031EDC50E
MSEHQQLEQIDAIFSEHFEELGYKIYDLHTIDDPAELRKEARAVLKGAERGVKQLKAVKVSEHVKPIKKATIYLANVMTQQVRLISRGKFDAAEVKQAELTTKQEALDVAINEYVERTGGGS